MSVADNLAFRVFDQPPYALRHVWLNRARIRWHGAGLIEKFRVKTSSPAAPVATLSGGNVQRVVLAREVGDEVELLVVANPCFGLDMASIAEIRARIMAARNRGAAILLVSEDLDEILELSDRIVVISRGVPELVPLPGEIAIDKPDKGAFYATDLERLLRARSIAQLVFAGVTTEVCVQTTMREANDRGYECPLAEDATESYFPAFKRAALDMITAQGAIVGWVSTVDGVAGALRGA